MEKVYRTDIDGWRAIAVISVILFHLDYLPNGYLGVDIFFVISGFLIIGIVFDEVSIGKFSILNFYERRIRRIIPVVLLTSSIAFIIGLFVMLPDDLESLSQSVFATNISANNILMRITSEDYWDVKNNYKPLMHTWSLGVEEQFYLFLPILFFLFKNSKKIIIVGIIAFLSLVSLFVFSISNNDADKFYLLQYRFFEIAAGGLCAIAFRNSKSTFNVYNGIFLFLFSIILALIVLLHYDLHNHLNVIKIILTTILTAGILVLGKSYIHKNGLYKSILCNPLLIYIGKISFSLYMWHQIVFAFARYFIFQEIQLLQAIILIIVCLFLSIISYNFIEKPFRNKNFIKAKMLLIVTCSWGIILLASSFYVYSKGGIIRNVPELGIYLNDLNKNTKTQDYNDASYNNRIKELNNSFSENNQLSLSKIKILVIGDSFARDFANILLESEYRDRIEISYFETDKTFNTDLQQRIKKADIIFYGSFRPSDERLKQYNLQLKKVWIIGVKNFGNSNGIAYNTNILDYPSYSVTLKKGIWEDNLQYNKTWGNHYLDLITPLTNENKKIKIFTPSRQFISQDTRHFTREGAKYYAQLLNEKISNIINQAKSVQ